MASLRRTFHHDLRAAVLNFKGVLSPEMYTELEAYVFGTRKTGSTLTEEAVRYANDIVETGYNEVNRGVSLASLAIHMSQGEDVLLEWIQRRVNAWQRYRDAFDPWIKVLDDSGGIENVREALNVRYWNARYASHDSEQARVRFGGYHRRRVIQRSLFAAEPEA